MNDIMIQQKGEKYKRWSHLEDLTPAEYFAQKVIIPLGNKIVEDKPRINIELPKLMRENLIKMKKRFESEKV